MPQTLIFFACDRQAVSDEEDEVEKDGGDEKTTKKANKVEVKSKVGAFVSPYIWMSSCS